MTRTYTYAEIAADYRLWMEYVDTAGIDTKADFDAMDTEQRIAIMANCFGPEIVEGAA